MHVEKPWFIWASGVTTTCAAQAGYEGHLPALFVFAVSTLFFGLAGVFGFTDRTPQKEGERK